MPTNFYTIIYEASHFEQLKIPSKSFLILPRFLPIRLPSHPAKILPIGARF